MQFNCIHNTANGKMMKTTILYRIKNDVNGNPRGVYVGYENGYEIAGWLMGYNGYHAIHDAEFRQAYRGAVVEVMPKQFREFEKRLTQPVD